MLAYSDKISGLYWALTPSLLLNSYDRVHGNFAQKSLFIPVYGYRSDGFYNIERDGNLLTVLGFIQTIADNDTLYCIAVPEKLTTAGLGYLASIQENMWARGINIVYLFMTYGEDPRHTRSLHINDMCKIHTILRYFNTIYIAPQKAALSLLDAIKAYKNIDIVYLAYAIAGAECTIESYRKMKYIDGELYNNIPMLVGTLDQLALYPEASRITKGYKSGDLLVRGIAPVMAKPKHITAPFILVPWKPSHEPYKVPIIANVLHGLLKQGYKVYSPYVLHDSNGVSIGNTIYSSDKATYHSLLQYGAGCIIPLLEPMHHCLHYTCYEALDYGNTIITVPNDEIPDHEWIINDHTELESALLKALNT